mmetsp:Transcript_40245/g.85831  ORF Transcript_40245/g.85831 Transcript_40245/m.85831 type:complete len:407 (-) Transcript_40245:14-1234(-)
MQRVAALWAAVALCWPTAATSSGRLSLRTISSSVPKAAEAPLPSVDIGSVGSDSSSRSDDDSCDLSVAGAVCFSDGASALTPPAMQPGLIGHWTFDEISAHDTSGNGHHGATDLQHGPSPAGGGYSAIFRNSFLAVPDSPQFRVADVTFSLWVYLADGVDDQSGTDHWCPLLRKGAYVPGAAESAGSPALLLGRRSRGLRFAMATTAASTSEEGEFLDSNARLPRRRWVHVAVVRHGARLLIYVNGILDAASTMRGSLVHNEYPLYVGGDPFTAENCGHTVYIDELRMLGHAVAPHDLQAEAAPALGGIDPSYVRLACRSCVLHEAVKSCPSTRHLCTSLELQQGGYQVARSLGWLDAGSHVWTHAAVAKAAATASANSQLGLGLCCEGASEASPRPEKLFAAQHL